MVAALFLLSDEDQAAFKEASKIFFDKVAFLRYPNITTEENQVEFAKEAIKANQAMIRLANKANDLEVKQYSDTPEHLEQGALVQIERAVNYLTFEVERPSPVYILPLDEDEAGVVRDLEGKVKRCVCRFYDALEGYPSYQENIKRAIKKSVKPYPNAFIAISSNPISKNAIALADLFLSDAVLKQTGHGKLYDIKKINESNEEESEGKKTPGKPHRTLAKEQGAIMANDGRLITITDKLFENVFTTRIGNNATGFFRRNRDDGKKELALDINIPVLEYLAKEVYTHMIEGNQGEVQVYLPSFLKELGLETTVRPKEEAEEETKITRSAREQGRANYISGIIQQLDDLWGRLPGDNTEYKVIAALKLECYNAESEVFTFTSPYILQLFNSIFDKEEKAIEEGKNFYLWKSDLIYSTVANEQNKAAVELAKRIVQGLTTRGLKADSKLAQNKNVAYSDENKSVTKWSITCAQLIKDCTLIRERLKAAPNGREKTRILRRTFPRVYVILKTKTDLFHYYKDLKITEVTPTSTTLDARIVITHKGKNPDFQRPIIVETEDILP